MQFVVSNSMRCVSSVQDFFSRNIGRVILLIIVFLYLGYQPSKAGINFRESAPERMPPVKITGRVVDSLGRPVDGASILIKGSKTGAVAGSDGLFLIGAPDSSGTLIISSVGYTTQEVKFPPTTDLTIVLHVAEKVIDEVEVKVNIGYGALGRKEVSSAISHVSGKDLLTGANNNALMSLQGKVAGLSITNTAVADPNSGASLQLRGVSSRNAGLGPLYVINGVPGGNIDNVNQVDILSVDVLKGGAASAIYGTRGSNGVVLITTKSGTPQSNTLYDAFVSFSFPVNYLKVLNKQDFLTKIPGATDYGGNTDWFDALTRKPAITHKHTLQFSGGNERNNYIISIDYQHANGLDLRSSKEQYGARINLNHTSKKGFFGVNLNVAPRVAKTRPNAGGFDAALELNPTYPVYDSLGNYKYFSGPGGSNPVEKARLILSENQLKELDMNASFKLNILKNLSTVLSIAYTGFSTKEQYFEPKILSYLQPANGGNGLNYASQSQYDGTQKKLEWVGNYSLDRHKHSLKLLGGYSYQYNNDQSFNANNRDFPFDSYTWNNLGAGLSNASVNGQYAVGSGQSDNTLIAFFGRLIYSFDKRYVFTASLRREGSSKFGPLNRWGNFPAVSAAWVLSDEKFMKGASGWLYLLKLRADYGETGNQDFPSYQSLLTYGAFDLYRFNGTDIKAYGPNHNRNPYLHWEKGQNFNVGFDFELFYGWVFGSFNYYTRRNKDLLGNYPVPVPPNTQPQTYVNVGSMENSGIEVNVNATIFRTKNASYNITFNGNTNSNKFISFSNQLYKGAPYSDNGVQRLQEGMRIGNFYMYRAAGVDNGSLMVYNKAGKAIPGNEAVAEDRQYVGNGLPKIMASLSNTFTYKKWDLSIFFRGAFGYRIYNSFALSMGTPAKATNYFSNVLTSAFDNNSKYSKLTYLPTLGVDSDYFLEPGSFVKIDNVSLGYTMKFTAKAPLSSVRAYATGRNLHTFTKYTGGDPDWVNVNGLWPGVANTGYYPSALQLLFGIQINF